MWNAKTTFPWEPMRWSRCRRCRRKHRGGTAWRGCGRFPRASSRSRSTLGSRAVCELQNPGRNLPTYHVLALLVALKGSLKGAFVFTNPLAPNQNRRRVTWRDFVPAVRRLFGKIGSWTPKTLHRIPLEISRSNQSEKGICNKVGVLCSFLASALLLSCMFIIVIVIVLWYEYASLVVLILLFVVLLML